MKTCPHCKEEYDSVQYEDTGITYGRLYFNEKGEEDERKEDGTDWESSRYSCLNCGLEVPNPLN